ncbi:MAG: replication-associated recombination protein A [Candidatus Riflebacteria bacterium]|nr:replication-associated recombination protein A [Candidatus Riflebacteria bacterium]
MNEDNDLGIPNAKSFAPLPERIRPITLSEIVGQEEILGEEKPLRKLLEGGKCPSMIFWGPPGCGKTTLALVISKLIEAEVITLSAVSAGIKDLKEVFEKARQFRNVYSRRTILFIDEIHRFNKSQQDALLPHVENGNVILIGATTENPSFEVISALLSRVHVIVLKSLSEEQIFQILLRALKCDSQLCRNPEIEIGAPAISLMALLSAGDARIALNMLESCCEVARVVSPTSPEISPEMVKEVIQNKSLRYDKGGEEHYNLISALHKSMRGSDPDASLYWLYRMIEGGEDCHFILRRMIRFASEDVGMAEPFALTQAMSAAQAFDYIGPPEGYIIMAQLAVYLSAAPKSNSLYLAEKRVKQEIRSGHEFPVPIHLRNAPTNLMKEQGYGLAYKYPHDFPDGFVKETYLPQEISGTTFYFPKAQGREKTTKERFHLLWPERYSSPGKRTKE